MKINSYKIVLGSRNLPLEVVVMGLIKNGWQPYGNPYLDKNGTEKQAMVTYEAEPLRITPAVDGEELQEIVHVKISENKPANKPTKKAKKATGEKNEY
jgi:hypothetical protein